MASFIRSVLAFTRDSTVFCDRMDAKYGII